MAEKSCFELRNNWKVLHADICGFCYFLGKNLVKFLFFCNCLKLFGNVLQKTKMFTEYYRPLPSYLPCPKNTLHKSWCGAL